MNETTQPAVAGPVEPTVRRVMRLHRVDYVEAPAPDEQHPVDGVCHYCALHLTDACADAVNGAAEEAFGGDCETRDVVYARA